LNILFLTSEAKKYHMWINTKIRTYEYNYLIRAAITEGGLGANVPAETIYAKT
jgi:hypothetical protein